MSSPPVIRIDLASTVPAYRQIADGIRAQLVHGAFAPGDQLPTVRQLAGDLGVHHNTVAEAYRTLAEEGWLELTRGRGATVLPRDAPRATREVQAGFLRRLRELVAEASAAGLESGTLRSELEQMAQQLAQGNGRSKS